MKRTELIPHLDSHGCRLLREGGRHSIYWNPANNWWRIIVGEDQTVATDRK